MKAIFSLVVLVSFGFVTQAHATDRSVSWIASWATAQQGPEPQNGQKELEKADLTDASVRQIVHLSAGGAVIRLQLSNSFGTRPLTVDAVRLALAKSPASPAIRSSTDRPVLFAGKATVTIPAGSVYMSDPVQLPVPPLSDLAISFHYPDPPAMQTQHLGSRATSYVLHGLHCQDEEFLGAEKTVRWLGIAEVDVAAPKGAGTIIAFGDSITDGHGATTDANDRWPDVLARQLQADNGAKGTAVVNEGIGGNHLLTDGLGQSALARFDRDVLGVSGGRTLLVLEGINDLGGLGRTQSPTREQWDALVQRLEGAYSQLIERAHTHGVKVLGATILPDGGSDYYHPGPLDEAARQAVNAWIRQPGHFDAVVDFDAVTRDPEYRERLLPAFDSGDHLHPGPAGYKAMGEAIPLGAMR